MRLSGTLNSWNDARGFGFIAQSDGGADIFVHVSEFSQGGTRPAVGEKVSYELGRGRDGKPKAIKVVRLAGGADRSTRTADAKNKKTGFSMVEICALAVIVVIAGAWGFKHLSASQDTRTLVVEPPAIPSAPVAAPAVVVPAEAVPAVVVPVEVTPTPVTPMPVAPTYSTPRPVVPTQATRMSVAPSHVPSTNVATTFRCDGRTRCPQMTSCAEATWFLNNCPGTEMDGNHDGIPCERQWCTGH